MKAAISIPDSTFALVESKVSELGISRSEFYATAARHYLDLLAQQGVRSAIEAALASAVVAETTDFDDAWVLEQGRRTLNESW